MPQNLKLTTGSEVVVGVSGELKNVDAPDDVI